MSDAEEAAKPHNSGMFDASSVLAGSHTQRNYNDVGPYLEALVSTKGVVKGPQSTIRVYHCLPLQPGDLWIPRWLSHSLAFSREPLVILRFQQTQCWESSTAYRVRQQRHTK
jgi:hypothetical protein